MKMMFQIGFLFGVCLLGEAISVFLPIPFPGTVLSMIILFLLLLFRVIKVEHIQQKADFLLKNMAFFFIPAGVGIISGIDLIRSSILPLIVVVVVTTILTFGATALTVQGVITLQNRITRARKGKTDAVRHGISGGSDPDHPGAEREDGRSPTWHIERQRSGPSGCGKGRRTQSNMAHREAAAGSRECGKGEGGDT